MQHGKEETGAQEERLKAVFLNGWFWEAVSNLGHQSSLKYPPAQHLASLAPFNCYWEFWKRSLAGMLFGELCLGSDTSHHHRLKQCGRIILIVENTSRDCHDSSQSSYFIFFKNI